jgi:2-polyprenyl-6-methoxyphenol hydroxylase-like FAD-dependent oxidoreductase
MTPTRVACCIAGGGPAGIVLGYLLARAGVETCVLEKHGDFLRDFRGDTLHPSTLEVMHELGLLDALLKLPHSELATVRAQIGGESITVADLSHLPTVCKFVALMPQWDFLDFLAERARAFPTFHLLMNAEVLDLLRDGETIRGVRAKMPDGEHEIAADLVIGADGRSSVVRERAGLPIQTFGAPIDVLWLRLPKPSSQKEPTTPQASHQFRSSTFDVRSSDIPLGNVVSGRIFVALDRGDYYQCAIVIAKGTIDRIREAGLPAFRQEILRVAPGFAGVVDSIQSWDEVKLLTVRVDRLTRWHRSGLLCIGDCAHAMSPIGGIGINLAIQDAVAAANVLVPAFRRGRVDESDLARVQARRLWPTKITQAGQVFIQDRLITAVLQSDRPIKLPFALKLLRIFPRLRRVPARILGLGVRPEHVRVWETQGEPVS